MLRRPFTTDSIFNYFQFIIISITFNNCHTSITQYLGQCMPYDLAGELAHGGNPVDVEVQHAKVLAAVNA
jgi:hypothetical protein